VGVGDEAPDFALRTLDGSWEARLSALRPLPVLLVLFETRWEPARRDLGEVERLHRRYVGRGLRVIGVALDAGEPDAQMLRDVVVTFPVLRDRGGQVLARDWGRPPACQAYLIGPDGRVSAVFQGRVAWRASSTRDRIEPLLFPEPATR
jgi:peroxiredoxin